ncbi:DUF4214 domain-containing protein [Roseiterribacter gracilis]|uniref:DUF4214 domain-containing protein n=1 Tax=Roseiterribacter gracilis TaxID=2812848 RepID=A0A8S8XED0_9PROT|nr:hypothetical protein TMPK1_24780 [Rhodospirillales bacterium TMPK1]
MFAFTVALTDPTGTLSATTLTQIQTATAAALRWVGQYIQGTGTLQVAVDVVAAGGAFDAEAGPDGFVPVGKVAGGTLLRTDAASKLVTGQDANGAADDLHVHINADALRFFWFDPTPDEHSDVPPDLLSDFESIVLHELFHALGATGKRSFDGSFPDNSQSLFDSATRFDPVLGWVYDSEAARAAYGGRPVPVDSTHAAGSRWYHLDLTHDSDPSNDLDLLFFQTPTGASGVRPHPSDIDLAILHDSGLQSAAPDDGDNIWFGNDGADAVNGAAGNDHLYLLAGNDHVTGGSGDDLIDGGDGLDVAEYAGVRAQYAISGTTGNRVVQASAGASEGRDTLRHVEVLQFADKTLFDLAGGDATVARLYSAAFARAPDTSGLAVQLDALHAGLSPLQLAANFIASAEFVARYGAAPSDVAYVTALYSNVLGRVPDQGGFNVQLDALAHGLSRAQLLLNFGESPENQIKVSADWLLV